MCPHLPCKYRHACIYSHVWKIACIYSHLWKIARKTPVFLWFCPYFGDLVQVQLVAKLLGKITLWTCTKSQKDNKITKSLPLFLREKSARFSPEVLQKWAHMKNWAHWRSYWTWGRCCVFTFQFPIALNLKGAFFKDLFDFLGPHWVTHNLSPNFYASYMRWWNVDMLKCCLWWQDVIMTHRHDDIMTMLTWWHDDVLTRWHDKRLLWFKSETLPTDLLTYWRG